MHVASPPWKKVYPPLCASKRHARRCRHLRGYRLRKRVTSSHLARLNQSSVSPHAESCRRRSSRLTVRRSRPHLRRLVLVPHRSTSLRAVRANRTHRGGRMRQRSVWQVSAPCILAHHCQMSYVPDHGGSPRRRARIGHRPCPCHRGWHLIRRARTTQERLCSSFTPEPRRLSKQRPGAPALWRQRGGLRAWLPRRWLRRRSYWSKRTLPTRLMRRCSACETMWQRKVPARSFPKQLALG